MLQLYSYSEKEIKELLNSIQIVVDTREKEGSSHIIEWMNRKKKPYVRKKIDFGDYSFVLPKNESLGILRDLDFSSIIVFERKQNLDEFVGNIVNDRTRIEKEFALCPAKLEMIIEKCQYKDLRDGNYRSKYSSEALLGTLHSWKYKYGVAFTFMQYSDDFPLYMYLSFQNFLKNYMRGVII